jgi:Transcriptional regulator PadR-like family
MPTRNRSLSGAELVVLRAGADLTTDGVPEFFGYLLAKRLTGQTDGGSLARDGTVYKILARLEGSGLLARRWEELNAESINGRPVRRLYRVTAQGFEALARDPGGCKIQAAHSYS